MARAPDHWLWRLSAEDWLAAARGELESGQARLSSRRTSVTHARRAAGMALNGVLVAQAERGWSDERCESIWGRSYIDHLRALARNQPGEDNPFDDAVAERCAALLTIAVMPPQDLVRLSLQRDQAAHDALSRAAEIVEACAELVGRRPEQA